MSELVNKLSQKDHPVRISIRPEATPKALKECIDRGYVHVKFTETRGGTELGLALEMQESNFSEADFSAGQGSISLVGRLTLDYVPVKCLATIDLSSMAGRGYLVPA